MKSAPSTSRVAAVAAGSLVLVALGGIGGATAAGLVTSAQIKDGTIVSRDVRNGALAAKDLSSAARAEFSEPGPAGAPGQPGPAGEPGQQGPRGEVGPQGETGAQGETGPRGEAGPQGDTGARGETGPQGEQGPRGLMGPQGQSGPQGWTGPQGAQGQQGPAGRDGVANYSMVSSENVSLGASSSSNYFAQVTAACPEGTVALGGGYALGGRVGDLSVMRAQPTASGYTVTVFNNGDTPGSVQAFATCATVR